MELNEVKIKKNKAGDITHINSIPVHHMANIVPLEEDVTALRISIRDTGLLHPIMMYKGAIIDGRRRTIACLQLGIDPSINELSNASNGNRKYTDKELMEIVLAENATRRNLSAAQRAIVAAKQTIAGNHKLAGYADAKVYAKEMWSVSHKTLTDAKWLVRNYSGYAEEIFENGYVVVNGKKWTGISGLVKELKDISDKDNVLVAGSKEYAEVYEMVMKKVEALEVDIKAMLETKNISQMNIDNILSNVYLNKIQ